MNLICSVTAVVFSVLFMACGVAGNESTKRDYRVYVKSNEPAVQKQFKALIHDFNQSVGLQVLQFEENEDTATSEVSLVAGLQNSTGKLGFGGAVYHVSRSIFTTERTAAMQIELDMDYVRARLPSAKETTPYSDLRLLFFHEVGHGLGFAHAAEVSDVMFADLNGSKDFLKFYEQVRSIYD